jgi:hypothetical protein
MDSQRIKKFLDRASERISLSMPEKALVFTPAKRNGLGGWNNYAQAAFGDIDVGFGTGYDAFVSGKTDRRRFWMAFYFTRKWRTDLAQVFRGAQSFNTQDLVGGNFLYVKPDAVPERLDLIREEVFGGIWISRYWPECQLPSMAMVASQSRRFFSDVGGQLDFLASASKGKNEGRDLVQGTYWASRRDRAFRASQLRKLKHKCEACGFRRSFRGKKVIDLHHVRPLAGGKWRRPSAETVLVLCPNCHRTAHLVSPPLKLRDIKALVSPGSVK